MSQQFTPVPIDQLAPAPATPGRIGQGTAVEQSRAVAEVQAAIVVAQQCPRRIDVARNEMRMSCQILGLAEQAFYKYKRGGSTVSGASVHLARELARCFGNVQYGIVELRRDDAYAQSEMQAWAWDVQMNTRASNTFIVPHMRDRSGGPVRLTDLRDIYENNANMGARRLREAIFSILPKWFTEEAIEICQATLAKGDGTPVEERIDGAIKAFGRIDVSLDRLEQHLGRSSDKWNGYDIAQLTTLYKSIQRGEIAVDEAFPQPRVTVEEIAAQAAEPPAALAAAPKQDPKPKGNGRGRRQTAGQQTATRQATPEQIDALNQLLATKCAAEGEARYMALAEPDLLGRDLKDMSEMTFDEAARLIEQLSVMEDYRPRPADDGPGTEPFEFPDGAS
ncbi:MAG TPA: hypothetical protein VIL36_17710 [Acidimicrobiales bacterium]|jgi:hypothetical protein